MNNPNGRSVAGFFFGVLEETAAGQEAVNRAETREEEQIEPRGWSLKWDQAALSQIRDERTGLGPLSVDRPTGRT